MKLFKLYMILCSLLLVQSCGQDLADLNIDPDTSPTASPKEVLTAGLGYYAIALEGYFNEENAVLAQYWAGGPGVALLDIEEYQMVPGDYNTEWSFSYTQALSDLSYVIANGNDVRSAVADIFSVYIYQNLVDHYGDIPYSEALGGADGTILTPAFDDAATIYADLLKRVRDAKPNLLASEDFGAEDLIYGGDVSKWMKFANSLELKLLIRQGGDVGDQVRSIVSGGNFISSADDMAAMAFSGGATQDWNPQYARREQGIGMFYVASNSFVDVMEELADPRGILIYDGAVNSGLLAGIDQGNVADLVSPSGDDFSSPSAVSYAETNPVIFMSNWEVMFLRAEAAIKYGTDDSDATMFNNAVTAHFDYVGAAGADTYLTDNASFDAGASDELKMNLIAVQKWIAMNGLQESEGWIEMRRLDDGDGVFTNPSSGILNTPTRSILGDNVYPSIRFYPQTELDFNSNTPSGRTLTDKVFWDK